MASLIDGFPYIQRSETTWNYSIIEPDGTVTSGTFSGEYDGFLRFIALIAGSRARAYDRQETCLYKAPRLDKPN